MKRTPIFRQLFLINAFRLLGCCLPFSSLHAQEDGAKPEVYYPSAGKAIAQGSAGTDGKQLAMPPPSTLTLLSQVFVFLLVLGGGALLLRNYALKGKFSLKNQTSGQRLVVSETKVLGNKQFLVVVEYGAQKMLLGVGPGMINHLCYLNSPFEDGALMSEDASAGMQGAHLPPEIQPDDE